MLIKLPLSILIGNIKVTENIPVFSTESLNMEVKSRPRGLHRLEGSMDITVRPTIESQKEWRAFIVKMQGRLNEFEIDLPMLFKSTNVTNPQMTKAYPIGSTKISLSSFTGTIQSGSMITFLNDTKIYTVLSDVSSNGLMEIFPALRKPQLINSPVEALNPVVTVKFKEDMQSYSLTENGFILETTLDWIEDLK